MKTLFVASTLVASQACDCDWAGGGANCGGDDGSLCWAVCCASGCDCSWTNGGSACGSTDGSVCWRYCCGGDNPPSPPGPSPPGPSPSGDGDAFCLEASDFIVAYGDQVSLRKQGYSVSGNGGAATKASFNLLGGYLEFDVDVSGVEKGVNANFYAIAPDIGSDGYQPGEYCDGAENPQKDCIELDWFESNGRCLGASTIHTVMGEGNNVPCTSWGCRTHWDFGGSNQPKFHMKVTYGTDGSQTVYRDGVQMGGWEPNPAGQDWSIIKQNMESKGVIGYGSEWTGWVPTSDHCDGNAGCLSCSSYSIDNIVIKGKVVQGPTPTKCQGSQPEPTPVPSPVPSPVPDSPVPVPTPSNCPGGDLVSCITQCPSDPSYVFQVCVQTCQSRCSGFAAV